MVAYLLAPWGELGASATPRVRRLFTASYPTFGYTSQGEAIGFVVGGTSDTSIRATISIDE